MIDFIKAREYSNVDYLLDNPLLNFKSVLNIVTGEIIEYPCKMPKAYKDTKLEINLDHYYFKGTFHKYRQNGRNWQDFTISDLKKAIKEYEEEIGLNIKDSTLHFLEYGVNIIVPFKPSLLNIRKTFISYKGKPFQPLRSYTSSQIGVECVLNQYRIKIYSKMLQYKLDKWVIRFEIQIKKMQKIKFNNLCVKDLYTNKELINYLKNDLVEVMKRVTVFDETLIPKTKSEKLFLEKVSNSIFWEGLDSKNLHRQKQRYIKIVSRNKSTLHSDLVKLVKKKGDKITTC